MRRVVLIASFMLVLLLTGIVGCKDGELPESGLEQFIDRVSELDNVALDDTLRSISTGPEPYSTYAHYMIGNRYYESATDSALVAGWDQPGVAALMDSAEVHFLACVERDTTMIEAYVNLGSLWDDRAQMQASRSLRDRRLETAREYYESALRIDPADEKALCNLGSLYMNQRKTSDALKTFETVLDHNPKSSLAHYNLAIMFAEAKIYREAIDEFEAAAKYDSDGDIGQRAQDNVKIIKDLMNSPDPALN